MLMNGGESFSLMSKILVCNHLKCVIGLVNYPAGRGFLAS